MSYNTLKTGLVAVLISIYIAVSYSVSTLFMTLLTGAIFIPPAVVFVYVLKDGFPLISRELRNLVSSGNEIFVISVTKEHITLEPEYK
ncbi:MAG: hypothetical protein ACNA7I_10385 [Candidatus Methanoperedens sp.]